MNSESTPSKERRKQLKAPYRQQRKSEAENCDEFIIESRQRQYQFDQKIAEQHRDKERVEHSDNLASTAIGIIKISTAIILILSVVWIISRWTSDYTTSSPSIIKGAQECYEKLNARLHQVEFIYLRPMSSNEKIKDLIQQEKNDLSAEIEIVKADIASMERGKEVRKARLSFGQYSCDPDRVIGRYANRIEREQSTLDQERLVRDEIEINQAMSDILVKWKNKSVEHYVSNGVGPRVDTFVLKDGSSVLCTTSFRNGIRAVSCNR